MYCIKCGTKLGETDRFCSACGEKTEIITAAADTAAQKRRKPWLVPLLAVLLIGAILLTVNNRFGMAGMDAYELDGLTYYVPKDARWEDTSIYDEVAFFFGEDMNITVEIWDEEDFDNCDITDAESFVTFCEAIRTMYGGESEIHSCRDGHYIVVTYGDRGPAYECCATVTGLYKQGDKGWEINVSIYNEDELKDLLKTAIKIASGGRID